MENNEEYSESEELSDFEFQERRNRIEELVNELADLSHGLVVISMLNAPLSKGENAKSLAMICTGNLQAMGRAMGQHAYYNKQSLSVLEAITFIVGEAALNNHALDHHTSKGVDDVLKDAGIKAEPDPDEHILFDNGFLKIAKPLRLDLDDPESTKDVRRHLGDDLYGLLFGGLKHGNPEQSEEDEPETS